MIIRQVKTKKKDSKVCNERKLVSVGKKSSTQLQPNSSRLVSCCFLSLSLSLAPLLSSPRLSSPLFSSFPLSSIQFCLSSTQLSVSLLTVTVTLQLLFLFCLSLLFVYCCVLCCVLLFSALVLSCLWIGCLCELTLGVTDGVPQQKKKCEKTNGNHLSSLISLPASLVSLDLSSLSALDLIFI